MARRVSTQPGRRGGRPGLSEGPDDAGVRLLCELGGAAGRNLVALEDAYGYRIIARHHSIDRETAVGLVLGYARLATCHPLAV
jgi:hypothetical protein